MRRSTLREGVVRQLRLLLVDCALTALCGVVALLLRDNFEPSLARLAALTPYLLLTVAGTAVVFPTFGISRTIWRFTVMKDYLRLLAAIVLAIVAAVAFAFGYNRLEEVARAVPCGMPQQGVDVTEVGPDGVRGQPAHVRQVCRVVREQARAIRRLCGDLGHVHADTVTRFTAPNKPRIHLSGLTVGECRSIVRIWSDISCTLPPTFTRGVARITPPPASRSGHSGRVQQARASRAPRAPRRR